MKLSDFNYQLPKDLIALYPTEKRTHSRLLGLEINTGQIQHHQFKDIIHLLKPDDLLVFNDSRVIPARLFGSKTTGGKVEILIEKILDNNHVIAHVHANRTPKINTCLQLENNIAIKIAGRHDDLFELKFLTTQPVIEILESIGHIPLPPYIDRSDELLDKERYQTVYAEHKGSVAAPTAGLHFDKSLLQQLHEKGIAMAFVTLHVGAGTFQPVRTEDIKEHKMHFEQINVTEDVCDKIKTAKAKNGRIIAVGTTSVRCLETAAHNGEIKPYIGDTNIFIYPGYQFQCVDAMITNFHLPESTLLMLISAFAEHENIMKAYQEAIKMQYRFYSYGDAMFIYKAL